MSPSDHSLSGPRTGRAAPVFAASAFAAPVLAAVGGAALFLLSALASLREAAPWALPLTAAASGAAAGLALLSARSAGRRAAPRDQAPPGSALPSPSLSPSSLLSPPLPQPVLPSMPATPPAAEWAAGAAVRIAALEEALRDKDRQAAERLRGQQLAAMDARAELASAIVHDVNNALGAVSGYADFLASDLPAGSPQADYANRIVTAVDRARPGLRRLVTAARMEAAPMKPERAAGILDEAAMLLRAVPAPPGSLAVRHDTGTPDPLCNADLLARTLAGLAAEILAATGRAGDARLCLRAAADPSDACVSGLAEQDDAAAGWAVRPLLMPHPGPHTLFELRVDGPPPADDVLSMLVDPLLFARACYRRGQSGRGDGAHWPAALLTARLHDGGLSLLTHPAEGTVVRLYIPAAPVPLRSSRPPVLAQPAPAPVKPSLAPACKVLVVDADPTSGDRFQTGLERQGFEVSVCDDLRDALDVVTDEPGFFDVVVVGPGLSALPAGLALAGRLKALRPDLPCVLYAAAGAGSPGAAAAPLEPGEGAADLLLPLPVDLPRLARGVAALVAGGQGSGQGSGDAMTGERR